MGELIQLWFSTQSFMLVATQQSSAEYDVQMEKYNIMVSCNTTDVSSLCHTSKACICFVVYILILVPFFVICSPSYYLGRQRFHAFNLKKLNNNF